MSESLLIARNATANCFLLPQLANRHGLITGATGSGKTVTLQTMAQSLSRIGVPVFMADVKGDLTGLSQTGKLSDKMAAILKERGLDTPAFAPCPTTLWDVFGDQGHPVRATVSDMGPLLLGRMLNLNDTQEGVLNLVFKIADDRGMLLLDLKDLRAMLQYVGDNAKEFTTEYGNVSAASIGAIQRGLMQIEQQGGDKFFGEPMLDIHDFMQTDGNGHGVVNILAADKLMNSPRLYATFLLWMLSELFEQLPEIGDPDKPKLVFFFDEAHLLFNEAPKARWISPTACWRSWATVSNTCCGLSRHATKKPWPPPRKPCDRKKVWTLKPPSPIWPWARRLSAFSTPRGARAKPSGFMCCRQAASSVPSPPSNAKPCCKTRWWLGSMKKPWTASRPTK